MGTAGVSYGDAPETVDISCPATCSDVRSADANVVEPAVGAQGHDAEVVDLAWCLGC
jgi:hypothetical protein